jgi:formylglycine-generating enzyme required for sulfatase activity
MYGTFDQGGNVWEWNDAVIGSSRGLRGGAWINYDFFEFSPFGLASTYRSNGVPSFEDFLSGFRLATAVNFVPEPSSLVLTMLASGVVLTRRKR